MIGRQKNKRMIDNHQFYHSLIKYNPDVICAFDRNGRIIQANPAAERITGLTRAEMIILPLYPDAVK